MNLREYYQKLKSAERMPTPARQFILTIAAKTGKSPKTIQQWLCGAQYPGDDESLRILSEETGIPAEELFQFPQ